MPPVRPDMRSWRAHREQKTSPPRAGPDRFCSPSDAVSARRRTGGPWRHRAAPPVRPDMRSWRAHREQKTSPPRARPDRFCSPSDAVGARRRTGGPWRHRTAPPVRPDMRSWRAHREQKTSPPFCSPSDAVGARRRTGGPWRHRATPSVRRTTRAPDAHIVSRNGRLNAPQATVPAHQATRRASSTGREARRGGAPQGRVRRPRRRCTPHCVTRSIASTTIERLIFETPCTRSRKRIGTSTMRPPRSSTRRVMSTWKQ